MDEIVYPSTEHAYQAAKFREPGIREKIRRASTPGKAKRASKNFAQTSMFTEAEKLDVMYRLLLQKFNKEPFKSKLLATHGQKIVEGNRWNDKFWGVCKGEGQNKLGKLIMDIRKQIRDKEDTCTT
ncbi:MAG: NADAR family protein [Candidatus Mariimomonas ferrooxydans]